MKTLLRRKLIFADDRKICEIAKRGGFTLNIAGRQEIEEARDLARSYARVVRESADH